MRGAYALSLALLVGCTPGTGAIEIEGSGTGTTGNPTQTGGTGTQTNPYLDAEVACEADEVHALLVWCDVTLSSPGTVTLELSADGVPTRTFVVDEESDSHRVLGWGLKADTEYTWNVAELSGTVSTGSLPAGFNELDMNISGSFDSFDGILIPTECGGGSFVIFDNEGDVIWYVRDDIYGDAMDAYEWVQETRTVLIGDGPDVVGMHVSGDKVLDLGTVAHNAHHDLGWWNGYTYVLHDYLVSGVTVDGIHVYDGDQYVDTFNLEDHFQLSGAGFFGDWSHGNGVNPTEDGEVIFSLLNFDTVLSIDGDPNSPTFLEILWMAEGSEDGLPGVDYSAPAGDGLGFSNQHNAHMVDDKLWLFDNTGIGGLSRAARYRLDEANSEVVLEEEWSVGQFCSFQGGAEPVPGGVLATCAPTRDISYFELGATAPSFTMNADCEGGGFFGGAMNRAIPIWVE